MDELDDFYNRMHDRLEALDKPDALDIDTRERLFYTVCQLWACSYPDGASEAPSSDIACRYLDKTVVLMENAVVGADRLSPIVSHILRAVEWPLREIPGFLTLVFACPSRTHQLLTAVLGCLQIDTPTFRASSRACSHSVNGSAVLGGTAFSTIGLQTRVSGSFLKPTRSRHALASLYPVSCKISESTTGELQHCLRAVLFEDC